MMKPNRIPKTDAEIVKRGEARFPIKGSTCDAACAFYAFCANSVDFGNCRGFVLTNGQNLAIIKRNLDENTVEYVKNSFQTIQRSLDSGDTAFAHVIVRDISRLGEIANPPKPQKEPINVSVFETYQLPVNANIQKPAVEPKPDEPERILFEDVAVRNIDVVASHISKDYPEICTPQCPYSTCPYKRQENYGKPCQQKTEWKSENA
jgi:hypothetical protein